LLANPAFHALDLWLRQRPVDPAELQTAVDQFLEKACQAAAALPGRPPSEDFTRP